MKIRGKIFTSLSVVAVMGAMFLTGCEGDGAKTAEEPEQESNKPFAVDSNKANLFQVGDELFSIPSPIQTAQLIKKSNAPYNKDILNDPKNASSYSTKFQRALNLGIYGADLGYVTMYDKTQDALMFLGSTKKLADDLDVSSAFDLKLMKRFESNIDNQDSLLALVSDAYAASDAYLKGHDRQDVGALILAGGWLEALYFAAEISNHHTEYSAIHNRIGEQKTSLENLIKLLQAYGNNEEVNDFIEHLIDLYYLFDDVKMTYVFEKPTTDAENKTTTINSRSEVSINEEQMDAITKKVEEIRNHITG